MILLISAFLAMADTVKVPPTPVDTVRRSRVERIDTLGQVEVKGRTRPAVMDAFDATIKAQGKQPTTPSLGDLLNKVAPEAQDYILHPFGFKERKKKRQRKRMQQIMQDYDHVKSFEELLDEAIKKQMEEDAMGK